MTLANVLFALVLLSGLATLVTLFAGVLSMGRDEAEQQAGANRSNRLMVWRVRLRCRRLHQWPDDRRERRRRDL